MANTTKIVYQPVIKDFTKVSEIELLIERKRAERYLKFINRVFKLENKR